MRLLLFAILLTSAQGCVGYSHIRADLIHARVSDEDVKAGRNPHLRIGMPIDQAKQHLEGLGFHHDTRPRPDSDLSGDGELTIRYVRSLPHPAPLLVCHHEIRVLLVHDGERLTDLKSEMIYTTVD